MRSAPPPPQHLPEWLWSLFLEDDFVRLDGDAPHAGVGRAHSLERLTALPEILFGAAADGDDAPCGGTIGEDCDPLRRHTFGRAFVRIDLADQRVQSRLVCFERDYARV